ncbi:MAG: hypothetical protein Q8P52_01385 [bacterium]|nr:hypothetical protein [bacterium]
MIPEQNNMPENAVPPQINAEPPQAQGEGGANKNGKSSVGAAIGSVIIIILLIAGAIYFWMTRDSFNTAEQNLESEVPNTEAKDRVEAELSVQGSSDEVADIEADLNYSDLEAIDSDLEEIEKGLE